ncbi:Serine/threonine protein kinase [Nannocystis exedens]|uniref:Serine/threonine protein kinase n=1 Tax=Nannocystis exedens TaxID=54 RepID=A0A1I2I0P0_9BACT|nr:serine/threonine-protein kinase [Nannocystis exedens]PCC67043.1 protein kinase [Nannocystis exedens]SFF35170.1 Serine/threonine protein kinase [Nannocystis exedens]
MSTPPHTPPDSPSARAAGAGTWADVDVHRLHARVMGRLFGEPAAPTMIGRFHVERRLGEGAMGVVYAAVDAQLNRRVAIKLLHPHLQGDDQGRARLLREARAMARLEHEHVARIYEVGAWGDQIYIAMELIEGVTLEAWLRERPRPWQAVLAVYLQAGRALAAAHHANLLHRDFKPENVLVDSRDRARVLDFGLTCALDAGEDLDDELMPLTRTGSILGTPAYMAPEQQRTGNAEPRSDQFSFCVALFEGLFGLRPFGSLPRFGQVEIAPIPRESRVPLRIRRAIVRGLSEKPDDRWPTMEELLAALQPRRRFSEAPEPIRARTWLIAGGAALTAAGLVALGVSLAQPDAGAGAVAAPQAAAPASAPADAQSGELAVERAAAERQAHALRVRDAAFSLLPRDPTAAALLLRELDDPGALAQRVLAEPISAAILRGHDGPVTAVRWVEAVPEDRGGAVPGAAGAVPEDRSNARSPGDAPEDRSNARAPGDVPEDRSNASAAGNVPEDRSNPSAAGAVPEDRSNPSRREVVLARAALPRGTSAAADAAGAPPQDRSNARPREVVLASAALPRAGVPAAAGAPPPSVPQDRSKPGPREIVLAGPALPRGAVLAAADADGAASAPVPGDTSTVPQDKPRPAADELRGAVETVDAAGNVRRFALAGGPPTPGAGGLPPDPRRGPSGEQLRADARGGVSLVAVDRVTPLRGVSGPLAVVAWSPDGARVAAAGARGEVWLIAEGRAVAVGGRGAAVGALAWDRHGRQLAIGRDDGGVEVWRVDGAPRRVAAVVGDGGVTGLALGTGWFASGSDDGSARVWRIGGTARPYVLRGHTGPVRALAFAPAGVRLITGSDDGSARVWRLTPAALREHDLGAAVHAVAWSPDGTALAAAGARSVWLLPTDDGPVRRRDHAGTALALAWRRDGQELAVADDSGAVTWIPRGEGEPRRVSVDRRPLSALAWDPRTARLAAGGSDGAFFLWPSGHDFKDMLDPTRAPQGRGAITALAWSPVDERLAAVTAAGFVLVRVEQTVFIELGHPLRALAWSPAGDALAVAGEGRALVRVAAATGVRTEIGRAAAALGSVAWDPRDGWIVAGAADGALLFWSLQGDAGPELLAGHGGGVNALAFDAGGDRLASAGSDGRVVVWARPGEGLRARLAAATRACLLPAERRRHLGESEDVAEARAGACERSFGNSNY